MARLGRASPRGPEIVGRDGSAETTRLTGARGHVPGSATGTNDGPLSGRDAAGMSNAVDRRLVHRRTDVVATKDNSNCDSQLGCQSECQ